MLVETNACQRLIVYIVVYFHYNHRGPQKGLYILQPTSPPSNKTNKNISICNTEIMLQLKKNNISQIAVLYLIPYVLIHLQCCT